MNLNTKGKRNYSQVLDFIENEIQTLKRNNDCCSQCSKDCNKCEEAIAAKFSFNSGIAVNRLYYSLFQITKSYLWGNCGNKFEHQWREHKQTLQCQLDRKNHQNLSVFINNMHLLRELRNKVDYEKEVPANIAIEAKRLAIEANKVFNRFEKELGDIKC